MRTSGPREQRWGPTCLRSRALRCRTELAKEVSHPRICLVPVRNEGCFCLIVEVAGQSLAVLGAQAVGGDGVDQEFRRRQPCSVRILERHEAVPVDVKPRPVSYTHLTLPTI